MEIYNPQSKITLYKGIPWDNSYKHTRWFTNINQQRVYFNNANKVTTLSRNPMSTSNYTFQRINSNSIRVNADFDLIWDCNYLSFNNGNYQQGNLYQPDIISKEYYAFITSVEYESDNVCVINYQLDILQSFMFEFQFQESFVEREIVDTYEDNIGDNLVEETLEIGEYLNLHTDSFSIDGSTSNIYAYVTEVDDNTLEGLDVFQPDTYGGSSIPCKIVKLKSETVKTTFIDNNQSKRIGNGICTIVADGTGCFISRTGWREKNIDETQLGIGGYYIRLANCPQYFFGIRIVSYNSPDLLTVAFNQPIPRETLSVLLTDPSGLISFFEICTDGEINALNSFYNKMASQSDAVVCIFKQPSFLDYGMYQKELKPPKFSFNVLNGEYNPYPEYHTTKNNKMFTYPFNFCALTCNDTSVELRYEFWEKQVVEGLSGQRHFVDIICGLGVGASMSCTPKLYKQKYQRFSTTFDYDNFEYNITQNLSFQLPWVYDNYQTWLADNKVNLAGQFLGDTIKVGMGIAGGNVAQGVSGALGIVNTLGQMYAHKGVADSIKGNINSLDNFFANDNLKIRAIRKCITPEYWKRIDDFFSVYGYKVNQFKLPLNSIIDDNGRLVWTINRPKWKYLKTQNCKIVGVKKNTPSAKNNFLSCAYLNNIQQIFDNGITLWVIDDVGNYGDFTNK